MSHHPASVPDSLLRLARAGDRGALGKLLESYRSYLLLLVRLQIGRKLQSKLDADDLVQETFLEAHRTFADFRGKTEKELMSWLRSILASHLAEQARRYRGTRSRNVGLERSLRDDLDRSSHQLDGGLVDPHSSPSQQAARREQAVLLADALAQLPAQYREVLILRHLEGLSFAEVGRRLGRSEDSVSKLWTRAIPRISRLLGGES